MIHDLKCYDLERIPGDPPRMRMTFRENGQHQFALEMTEEAGEELGRAIVLFVRRRAFPKIPC